VDAVDVLLEKDRDAFRALKAKLDLSGDAVMMKYNTAFDGQGNATFSYYRERLVNRARGFVWKEPVHEYIEIYGNIIQSDIAVTHTKSGAHAAGRIISIYEALIAEGKSLTPRGQYYYARELTESGRFSEAAMQFETFLDDGQGWLEDNISACAQLASCYAHENRYEKQLEALARSFVYDTPRAEICCDLGYAYKSMDDYGRAVFWFRLATTLQKPLNGWGFMSEDCWGYIPYVELAVCYDRLGETQLAEMYNECAARIKPDDPAVLYNRDYFRMKRELSESVASDRA
jgi:tetratricopeptide (TPR) repeat protein